MAVHDAFERYIECFVIVTFTYRAGIYPRQRYKFEYLAFATNWVDQTLWQQPFNDPVESPSVCSSPHRNVNS
jgi:hypothetical protein